MARRLVVEIVGDASSLEREFKRSAAGAKRFERQIGQIGRGTVAGAFHGMGRQIAFASAGFLSAAGSVNALRGAFSELAESQRVAAQTSAVLRSTRGIAGVTAEDVDRLGNKLLKLSGIDDEVIKSGENLLLTFTNVRNVAGSRIFDQATRSALDMSVAMGEDLQSAIVRVGKALQDPVKGASALRRVGVMFTDQQQKQIKGLVEQNRLLDAQKIILGELGREFGGSAAAFGATPTGKVNLLRETFKNFSAEVVAGTQQGIVPLVDELQKWLDNQENLINTQRRVNAVVHAGTSAFEGMASAVEWLNRLPKSHSGLFDILAGSNAVFDALTGGRRGAARPGITGPVGGGKPFDPNAPQFVPPGTQGPVTTAPPGSAGSGPRGVTAAQRNQWFDSMVSRRLNRVQDVRTLQGQVAALTAIAGLIRQRLAKTKDITRQQTLEDQLVGVFRERAGINAMIAANKNERERLRLLDEAEDLANRRARSLERLRNAQANAREAFGELGRGAILSGPMMDRLREWGGKATAQDFIADLRSQVQAFTARERDLATLKRRGVSKFAIDTLKAQGQAGTEEIHALAGARAGELQTFNKLIGQRKELLAKAAQVNVQSPRVTITAASVSVHHGTRKQTSRADERKGVRAPGH